MPTGKFNLLVYFEPPAEYDREEIEEGVREAARNPEGPADDPMFTDNMTHSIERVYFEPDNTHPHVRVAINGTGFVGKEAALVSSEVIKNMEEAIIEHTDGEHYSTSYSADALK